MCTPRSPLTLVRPAIQHGAAPARMSSRDSAPTASRRRCSFHVQGRASDLQEQRPMSERNLTWVGLIVAARASACFPRIWVPCAADIEPKSGSASADCLPRAWRSDAMTSGLEDARNNRAPPPSPPACALVRMRPEASAIAPGPLRQPAGDGAIQSFLHGPLPPDSAPEFPDPRESSASPHRPARSSLPACRSTAPGDGPPRAEAISPDRVSHATMGPSFVRGYRVPHRAPRIGFAHEGGNSLDPRGVR